jgi:hypothetical protein
MKVINWVTNTNHYARARIHYEGESYHLIIRARSMHARTDSKPYNSMLMNHQELCL